MPWNNYKDVLVKDFYDNGECPNCYENILNDATEGDDCYLCGHVFTEEDGKDTPYTEN